MLDLDSESTLLLKIQRVKTLPMDNFEKGVYCSLELGSSNFSYSRITRENIVAINWLWEMLYWKLSKYLTVENLRVVSTSWKFTAKQYLVVQV